MDLAQLDGSQALGERSERTAGIDLGKLPIVADEDELRLRAAGGVGERGDGGAPCGPCGGASRASRSAPPERSARRVRPCTRGSPPAAARRARSPHAARRRGPPSHARRGATARQAAPSAPLAAPLGTGSPRSSSADRPSGHQARSNARPGPESCSRRPQGCDRARIRTCVQRSVRDVGRTDALAVRDVAAPWCKSVLVVGGAAANLAVPGCGRREGCSWLRRARMRGLVGGWWLGSIANDRSARRGLRAAWCSSSHARPQARVRSST